MKYSGVSFISAVIAISFLIECIRAQCCLKFNGVQCITCPGNMHVYRGNCIYNLPFCQSYSNGFDCSECNDGYQLENSACVPIRKVEQRTSSNQQPKPKNLQSQIPKSQSSKLQSQIEINKLTPEQVTEYKEFTIDLPLDPSGQNQRSERALFVDQIMRSTYPEIRKAEITKAIDRMYPNNSNVVDLIYRVNGPGNSQTFYQGLMVANLDTLIFEELSFKKLQHKAIDIEKHHNQITQLTTSKKPNQQPYGKLSQHKSQPNASSTFTQANNTQSTSFLTIVESPIVQTAPITQKSQTISFSESPQDEYSKQKFVRLSDIDALVDINFVIALNQINKEIPELQGIIPLLILAQIGYNSTNLSIVHYIITFQIQGQNHITHVQEVRLKVDATSSEAKIDSIIKKQHQNTPNSIPMRANFPNSEIQQSNGNKISEKKSYTEINGNPAQADIYFLIFLDNLGKGLENQLRQSGKRADENEIIYAGRIDWKDTIDFWVQMRVKCVGGTQSLFKVTGTEDRMTYEVKLNEIVLLQEIKSVIGNIEEKKDIRTQKQMVKGGFTKKLKQPKQYISESPKNLEPNPVINSSSNTVMSEISATGTNKEVKRTKSTLPTVMQIKPAHNSPEFLVSEFQSQTLELPKTQLPFQSETFTIINQTIAQRAGGLTEIDPTTVQRDDGVLRSMEILLAGRPNRENIKLYKAYIKNYGIKAEYKIYLIDLVSSAPKIGVMEGYVTYDLMRKRIFVISYGSLGL